MVDASRQDDAFGASAGATYPRCRDGCSRVRGFTILELLVVMLILTVLISTVVVVGTTVIQKSQVTNTKAVLQVVADALEEFKREQQTHRTITKRKAYRSRYGDYPPDELEVFTPLGVPGDLNPRSLAVGGAPIVPTPGPAAWPNMRFYVNGNPLQDSLEHRDLAAMIVAIETMSEKAALILGRLPKRNRTSGPIDPATGEPSLWLDRRDKDGKFNGQWDAQRDFQIRYIVDAWGVPLSYLAQRDWTNINPPPVSTNHPGWNEASAEIIRINR
ncbi:MAG: type II secretion system protein, partial [Planctomycetes bacterium]|nr:type II secretion system protein [Planctomycetota bacterium]